MIEAAEIARWDILPREFYNRSTIEVARGLIGMTLLHGRTAGRIVEVEAYLGREDGAAHASRGITTRTRVLFGPPGHVYVYLIYGMYECLNLVAEPEGTPGCVLLRAIEPQAGIDLMRRRRKVHSLADLASGPGKLTVAMGITRRHNGLDATKGPLTIRRPPAPLSFDIGCGPRIGITKAADWPLRFFLRESPCLSYQPHGASPTRASRA